MPGDVTPSAGAQMKSPVATVPVLSYPFPTEIR